MKFYNREIELEKLRKVHALSQDLAQLTFVVGRRRIGKTSLLLRAFDITNTLYLFVAKKNEALLCEEFIEEVKQKLAIPIFGEIKSFSVLFEILMQTAKQRHFTVIIDEFQELNTINPAIFSDMQRIWDTNKEESRINLVACGSIYSIMTRIFENAKEPLFGRATQRMHIQAFNINTLKEILNDYAPSYSAEDLLTFYMVTGGVAKYVELLVQNRAFSKDAIVDTILTENSLFLDEGKHVLIEEFGKEYGNYFSILSLIAAGKTARVEIESILEMETGGYLARLEKEYKIIQQIRPILAKPGSRIVKYKISDQFLSFWFRFIYKNRSAVEAGNLGYVKEIIARDFSTYSGRILEDYFIQKVKTEKKYNLIGTYWEKTNQNEIDIVAVNELKKTVLFGEVKRQRKNISLGKLKEKSLNLQKQFEGYSFTFKALGMEDM
jgi:AAA+ ATPase superfamily predicted ATPase